jgi:DhnA family fructose-bisphosphate aldolase class Ia
MRGGAAGVAFGRNIWQSQNPEGIVRAIVEIVHGKKSFGKEDKPIPKGKSSL